MWQFWPGETMPHYQIYIVLNQWELCWSLLQRLWHFQLRRLTLSDKSIDNLFLRANIMLPDFAEWCFVNRLSLAPTKSGYILFSRIKEVPELALMQQPIKRANECSPDERSFKLVGIHLDDFLSWKYHVDHVRKKDPRYSAYDEKKQKFHASCNEKKWYSAHWFKANLVTV